MGVHKNKMIRTSVGLVSSFFDTSQESVLRISQISIPLGYEYLTVYLFPIPFEPIYQAMIFMPG